MLSNHSNIADNDQEARAQEIEIMHSIYKPYNFSISEDFSEVVLTAVVEIPEGKYVFCGEADLKFELKPFAVELRASLPVNYPSEAPPEIKHLSGPFLSPSVIEIVKAELREKWTEQNPVLFDWCSYLQNDLQTLLFGEADLEIELDELQLYKNRVWKALNFLL